MGRIGRAIKSRREVFFFFLFFSLDYGIGKVRSGMGRMFSKCPGAQVTTDAIGRKEKKR